MIIAFRTEGPIEATVEYVKSTGLEGEEDPEDPPDDGDDDDDDDDDDDHDDDDDDDHDDDDDDDPDDDDDDDGDNDEDRSENRPLFVSGPVTQTHALVLRDLVPGQRYNYRVFTGNAIAAADTTLFFETDAGPSDPEFSFFVTGDIGEPGGMQAVTAARILVTEPRVKLGLLAGDIVYPKGSSKNYDANLMRPWAALLRNVPVWPALGNHDWEVDPGRNFVQEWYLPGNEHYYSFDHGNAHFVALDTGADGDIYDRAHQLAWLRADLAANRAATWTFVYYHHPGRTCTYKDGEPAVATYFHPIFDEFSVDVAFMAHAHTYERLYPRRGDVVVSSEQEPHYVDPQGTIYVISGCGATLSEDSTPDCELHAVAIDETYMFTHVTVRGREVIIRAIESKTGITRDEMTIHKSGP